MNNAKYKDTLYDFRYIRDLKDLVDTSAEIFADRAAYLVKETLGGEYKPISYLQFKKDIDALGTSFINLGLKGKKIAVIGENSYEWVLTYMATVNGTGVIVPLDRELPPKEIAHLMKRSEVGAIVYSKKLKKTVEEAIESDANLKLDYMICMETDEEAQEKMTIYSLIGNGRRLLDEGDISFIDTVIDREAMCSLLFTSGTTGLAKGVMLSHKNISANVYNMSKYVKIIDRGVGLSVLPMHHSYEMTCHIFTAMYQGMSVAICEGLKYITKNLVESKATVMLGVPLIFESMHKKVMKKIDSSGKMKKVSMAMAVSNKFKLYNTNIPKKIFKDIHEATGGAIDLFIAGGAAINPKVIEEFQSMGFPMIQGYGMTENSPIIAVNRDRYSKAASVGPPMPGTQVKLIDKDENGIGEIVCRGDSVMIGYYNDKEETDKVLIDGWLHTGDYGYFDDEGFLYIAGRKKSVIVTKNGKNIFPEEVEYYLGASEYIEEVLVHGIVDERSGDTVVKAEIFPNLESIKEDRGELSKEDLRIFMKTIIDKINEEMPLYKRVKKFSIRETEFEKTTTRKIKRHSSENKGEHLN